MKPVNWIQTAVMLVFATAAAWRGFKARRRYWSMGSWIRFGATLLVGFTLIGFTFYVSATDRSWMGAPRSNVRFAWAIFTAACLVAGGGITVASLIWFAQGEPSRKFSLRRLIKDARSLNSPHDREALLPEAERRARSKVRPFLED